MIEDFIFECYLEDKCPVCNKEISMENQRGIIQSREKVMARYFICSHCFSEYTVGYRRGSINIPSEITRNTIEETKNG